MDKESSVYCRKRPPSPRTLASSEVDFYDAISSSPIPNVTPSISLRCIIHGRMPPTCKLCVDSRILPVSLRGRRVSSAENRGKTGVW